MEESGANIFSQKYLVELVASFLFQFFVDSLMKLDFRGDENAKITRNHE